MLVPTAPRVTKLGNSSINLKIISVASRQSNQQKGRIDVAHRWFSRICQVEAMGALSNACFPGTTRVHTPNSILMGSAVSHSLWQKVSILYNGPPISLLKSGLPSNTWFLGPTRVHNSNGISIGSAIFAGLTIVTDRPRYSVMMGRICVVLRCGLIIYMMLAAAVDIE